MIFCEILRTIARKKSSTIFLNINGSITSDPKSTSEELNNHFSTIAGKIRRSMTNNSNENSFAETLKDSPINSLFFEEIQANEIVKIINSLKPKSDGPYSIPTPILKTVLHKISEILTKIFNLSIQTGR